MATNHTTNYALNLWEPTDAFLREEFNENSEKIDAALDQALRFVKLKEIILTTVTSSINLDITDLDLSQFIELHFFTHLLGSSYCSAQMSINGCWDQCYMQSGNNNTVYSNLTGLSSDGNQNHFVLPCLQQRLRLTALPYGGSNTMCWSTNASLNNLSALQFFQIKTIQGSLQPGSEIYVYGLRK